MRYGPAALMLLAPLLLAAAAVALLADAPRDTRHALFAAGLACWLGGATWGVARA